MTTQTPHQRAVALLFGWPDYVPNDPDEPFHLRVGDNHEQISVNQLAARIAEQDAAQ